MLDRNLQKRIVAEDAAAGQTAWAAPPQRHLCGLIYAIVYLAQALEVLEARDEGLRDDNFGISLITLRCHAAGVMFLCDTLNGKHAPSN